MIGRQPLATALWTKESGIIIFHFYHSVKSWQFMSEHSWVKYYKRCSAEDLSHLELLENVALEPPPPSRALQSLVCFSVQFIATIPQCTLSAEQIHLPPSNHLERAHCLLQYTEEGNRRGREMGFWTCRLRVWPVGYSNNPPPPRGVKNNQRFIWLSRQTGAWRDYYLCNVCSTARKDTHVLGLHAKEFQKQWNHFIIFRNKMWQIWHILWLYIKKVCSFPKYRQKFPVIFILFNANL